MISRILDAYLLWRIKSLSEQEYGLDHPRAKKAKQYAKDAQALLREK